MSVSWNNLMGSGLLVPDDDADLLEALWQAHLRTVAPSRSTRQSNPSWERDEEILALDLYLKHGDLGPHRSEVIELSNLLRSLPIHPERVRGPNFRSPNSVSRKLGDIRSHAPGYSGVPTSGSALDKEIWEEFRDQPDRAHQLAETIRAFSQEAEKSEDDEAEVDVVHREGRIVYRMHRHHERDPRLRKRKITMVRKEHGHLICEACGLVPGERYGSAFEPVLECHHLIPLHATGERPTSLDDVALLCPTCHRVAHRITPWPTLAELQAITRDDEAE